MSKKKSKSIIPFFSNSNQGLVVYDNQVFEISLNPDETQGRQYLLDRIKELEDILERINPSYVDMLEKFRDLLSGHCINKGRKITILQCDHDCQFKICKTKNDWITLLKLK